MLNQHCNVCSSSEIIFLKNLHSGGHLHSGGRTLYRQKIINIKEEKVRSAENFGYFPQKCVKMAEKWLKLVREYSI